MFRVKHFVTLVAGLELALVGCVLLLLVLIDGNLEAEDLSADVAGKLLGVGVLGQLALVPTEVVEQGELHVALLALVAQLLVLILDVVVKRLPALALEIALVAIVSLVLMLNRNVLAQLGR